MSRKDFGKLCAQCLRAVATVRVLMEDDENPVRSYSEDHCQECYDRAKDRFAVIEAWTPTEWEECGGS